MGLFNFKAKDTATKTKTSERPKLKFNFSLAKKSEPTQPTEEQTKKATLPDFLGGGSYTIDTKNPGKVVNTGRSTYGGVDTKKDYQRDDIVPVSLGGDNSSPKNIRSVPTEKNPAQLEAQIAQDYKDGKITLGQARLKILTFKQERDNPLPTQNLAKNLFAAAKEMITGKKESDKTPNKSLLQQAGEKQSAKPMSFPVGENLIPEQTQKAHEVVSTPAVQNPRYPTIFHFITKAPGDVAKGFTRGVAEAGLSGIQALSRGKQDESQLTIQPKSKIERFVFGDEEMKPLATKIAGLEQQGVKLPLAFGLVVGSTAMDLTPFGAPEKGLTKEVLEHITEQEAKGLAKEEIIQSVKAKFGQKVASQVTENISKAAEDLGFKTNEVRPERDRLDSQIDYLYNTLNRADSQSFVKDGKLDLDAFARREKLVGNIESGTITKNEVNSGLEFSHSLEANPEAGFIKPPKLSETKLGETLYPLESQDPVTQDAFRTMQKNTLKGKELANTEVSKIKVPNEQGLQTILDYQAGKPTPYSEQIKTEFDRLFKEANDRGYAVKYTENYLPQIYDNSSEEVKTAMSKYLTDKGVATSTIEAYVNDIKDLPKDVVAHLKINPSFTKTKAFPDYATAMEYGLTPKYTNPAQLLAHYRYDLERSFASHQFVDEMINRGKIGILEAAKPDWKPINLPFSPKGYYAEPKLADMLNGIYRDENTLSFGQKVVKTASTVSKKMQDLTLSAGLPRSNINFFAMGQAIKELASGRPISSLKAFIRSNFNKASIRFFEEKAPVIARMAEEGLDLGGRIGQYDKVYENLVKKNTWQEALGNEWDKSFNEKTFASFMPQMYVQTFEDAEKRALKQGLDQPAAQELAAQVIRKFYGIMENVGRSKTTEDTLSAVLFAPKFRESLLNMLGNTLKSLTTEIRNPEYYLNRRFAIGATIMFGAYDALNYKLNGQHMWENEPGKEFELRIPAGDNIIYTPVLPSFTALPRNLASGGIALAKGDLKTAAQKFGSALSSPIKLATEVISNTDYFGHPIYDKESSLIQKLKDVGKYVGLNYNHPYVSELIKLSEGKQPLYQTVSKMLELPLKFSTLSQANQQRMLEAARQKSEETAKHKEKFRPTYDEIRQLIKDGKESEAQSKIDSLTEQDYEAYKSLFATDKKKETSKKEAEIYPIVEQVNKLMKAGKDDEAQNIVDSLTDDQYEIYKTVKKKTK